MGGSSAVGHRRFPGHRYNNEFAGLGGKGQAKERSRYAGTVGVEPINLCGFLAIHGYYK